MFENKRKSSKNGFENWGGYMNAKKSKLQEQFNKEVHNGTGSHGIFEGIAIFVNGYTDPTADELRRILLNHGGIYHHYMSENTTHIIASNLANSKKNLKTNAFTVRPDWITDSIKSNKLLDYRKYLLCDEEKQSRICFSIPSVNNIDISNKSSCSSNISTSCFQENFKETNLIHNGSCSENSNGKFKPSLSTKLTPSIHSTSNTTNPKFLSEFYSNSRLHHIATAGAYFKQYVQELQSKKDKFIGREHLKTFLLQNSSGDLNSESESFEKNVVMHLDIDCFFVSVGLLDYPNWRGLPVAVTHSTRGINSKNSNDTVKSSYKYSMAEISSCSYEAREKGLKNGMLLGKALELCPDLKSIPYNFEGYKKVSQSLYDIVASYTKNIEAVSCDEMYIDLDEILEECTATPLEFASCIRKEIFEKTQCQSSVGIGPNMLIARLATKKAKPNGQIWVRKSNVSEFMSQQLVSDLPGIGRSHNLKFKELKVSFCFDLQNIDIQVLQSKFGEKTAKFFYDSCRGVDHRKVNSIHERKSVSAEVNYGIRFENWYDAENFLLELSEEVTKRLIEVLKQAKTITLKIKIRASGAPVESAKFMGHGHCDSLCRSVTLTHPVSDSGLIFKESFSLLKLMQINPKDLRGIGIQLSKLETLKYKENSLDKFLVHRTNLNQNKLSESPSKSVSSPSKSYDESPLKRNNVNCFSKREKPTPSKKGSFNQIKSEEIPKNCQDIKKLFENIELVNQLQYPDSQKVLDVDILKSLPPDLKTQVIKEYKRDGYLIPEEHNELNLDIKPSDTSNETVIENISNANDRSFDVVAKENDFSFSQISQSFLDALPVDIIQDIKVEFDRKRNLKLEKVGDSAAIVNKKANVLQDVDANQCKSLAKNPCDVGKSENLTKSIIEDDFKNFISKKENINRITSTPNIDCSNNTNINKFSNPASDVSPRTISKEDSDRKGKRLKVKSVKLFSNFDKYENQRKEVGEICLEAFNSGDQHSICPTLTEIFTICEKTSSQIKGENLQPFDEKLPTETELKISADSDLPKTIPFEPDTESGKNILTDCDSTKPIEPNLCGESRLEHLKVLISEWIQCCEEPTFLDTQIISTFCQDLVRFKDLEKLQILLRFLIRKTQNKKDWSECISKILESAQEEIILHCGAPMKL